MSKFQELYNAQREWKGSINQEGRKSLFKNARRERRTRMFDVLRGDIAAAYKPEAIKPTSKITFRDTLSKVREKLGETKQKAVKESRPAFIVGTVKHKIHSPPFLHSSHRVTQSRKKCITPIYPKSFAPKNHKFRAPEGLKGLMTPFYEDKTVTSPFCLNTVWNKLDDKNTRTHDLLNENVTFRPRGKRSTALNSSSDSLIDKGTISGEDKDEHKFAKRELWPDDEKKELIFGRFNLLQRDQAHINSVKDNTKDNDHLSPEEVNQSVRPGSSSQSNKEELAISQIKNHCFTSFGIASRETISTKNHKAIVAETSHTVNECQTSKCIPVAEEEHLDATSKLSSGVVPEFNIQHYNLESQNNECSKVQCSASSPSSQNSALCNKSIMNASQQFEVDKVEQEDCGLLDQSISATENYRSGTLSKLSSETEPEVIMQPYDLEDQNNEYSEVQGSASSTSPSNSALCTKSVINSSQQFEVNKDEQDNNTQLDQLINIKETDDRLNTSTKLSTKTVAEINIQPYILQDQNNEYSEVQGDESSTSPPNSTSYTKSVMNSSQQLEVKQDEQNDHVQLHQTNVKEADDRLGTSSKLSTAIVAQVNIGPYNLKDQNNEYSEVQASASSTSPPNSELCTKSVMNSSQLFENNQDEQDNHGQLDQPIAATEADHSSTLSKLSMEIITEENIQLHNLKDQNDNLSQTFVVQDGKSSMSSPKSISSSKSAVNKSLPTEIDQDRQYIFDIQEQPLSAEEADCLRSSSELPVEAACKKDIQNHNLQDQSIQCSEMSIQRDSRSSSSSSNSISSDKLAINKYQQIEINQDKQEICTKLDRSISSQEVLSFSSKLAPVTVPTTSTQLYDFEDQNNECSQVQGNKSSSASLESMSSDNSTTDQSLPTVINNVVQDSCNTSKVPREKARCNKLCCHVDDSFSSKLEKDNESVANTQYSLDPAVPLVPVASQTPSESRTPTKFSLIPTIEIKTVTTPGLAETAIKADVGNEAAFAGNLQPCSSTTSVPVIDLTDSPAKPVPGTTRKFELRKSTLDYVARTSRSSQRRNPPSSSADENVVVDLISDDEEDYTCEIQRVLKKYAKNSDSSKQSPRCRTPLASIENISLSNSSPRRTPQSPRISTTAKRTPVSLDKTISREHISSSPQPLDAPENVQVLQSTPRKTPRKLNALKDIAVVEEVASPLRVMSLRTRTVSVSPSPKKRTPRKTPVRRKVAKELVTESNEDKELLVAEKANDENIDALSNKKKFFVASTPKETIPLVITPCKTPLKCNTPIEFQAGVIEDPGHLRVMNLRSRNVSVSPSPKKMTPRRRKNDQHI